MSREIDRQVAEAIGIQTPLCECTHGQIAGIPKQTKDRGIITFCRDCNREFAHRYSTDISAAIGALEEFCKANGYRWDLLSYGTGEVNCTLFRSDSQVRQFGKIEASIPLAICAAIIAASREAK